MKRSCILVCLLAVSTVAPAAQSHDRRWSSHHTGDEVNDCDDIDFSAEDGATARDREERTLPAGMSLIRATASRNGGIFVRGWNRPEAVLIACLGANDDTEQKARALVDGISVVVDGDGISVKGPNESGERRYWGNWWVYFILNVPKQSSVDLTADNGGVSVVDLQGTVSASVRNGGVSVRRSEGEMKLRTVNGGVSLRDVDGKIDARTDNGGVSFEGNRGDVTLEAQNGGINITLAEDRWAGERLSARTQNGGLTLEVPANYMSGIEATTSWHSRLQCRAAACRSVSGGRDEDIKHITLGDGPALVTVSTGNGGLIIRDR